jgi:uncharacterized protein (TIGR03083 family)
MFSDCHTLLAHSAGARERPLWARPLVIARVAGWCEVSSDIWYRLRHRSTLPLMTIDLGVLYRTCRERVTELVSGPDVDPELVVPATPNWTVRDVIAHLSGISEDAANGNMAGAPGDEWTAAQVTRHRGTSMADLLAMWQQYAPGMEAFFSAPGGAAMAAGVFDVHTHEADLRNALGLPLQIPADALAWAGEGMRAGFAGVVDAAGLPQVELPISDVEWFRGRLGRRTEAEVRAYPWPSDPDPYLEHFFIFGRAAHSLGEAA